MASPSTLPTELIQTILLSTNPAQDTATYYSARITCHRWYKAASTPFIVREVISQTPAIAPTPLPPLHSLAERDWNILFNQVAGLNLLHHRTGSETISGSGYGRAVQYSTRELPPGCTSSSTPMATSGDGKKLAIVKGAQVTVYNNNNTNNNNKEGNVYESTYTFTFTLTQSLYPSWTSICHALHQGALGSNHGYAKHHLAISSHGNLIAVGLGKKIQIYDYSAPKNTTNNTPAEYVLGQTETVFIPPSSTPSSPNYQETDGVAESLEFADHDTLLRVGIGKESNPNRSTRVRYLGDPSSSSSSKGQCLEYWRENLNRVYLDSVALATLLPDNDHKTAFKGLRLFPETAAAATAATTTSSRSFIAALQAQESRGYCIAEINHHHHHQQPDANATVTIKRHLPSRTNHHHSPNTTTTTTTTTTIQEETNTKPQTLSLASQSRWNPIHLPTTTTQNPLLAISPDEKLLLVYEPGAGHSYYCMRGGAVYVYCLETFAPVSFSFSSSSSTGGETSFQAKDATVMVQPWSYLLDIVDVDVEKLEVAKIRSRGRGGIRAGDDLYTVTALGGGQVMKWCLG